MAGIRIVTIHAVGRWDWNLAGQRIEFIPHGKRRPVHTVNLMYRDNTLDAAVAKAMKATARNPGLIDTRRTM